MIPVRYLSHSDYELIRNTDSLGGTRNIRQRYCDIAQGIAPPTEEISREDAICLCALVMSYHDADSEGE